MDLKTVAFINNLHLIWQKNCSIKESKALIMFTANENLFQLVPCYTSFIEIRCLKHVETTLVMINARNYDSSNKNSIEIDKIVFFYLCELLLGRSFSSTFRGFNFIKCKFQIDHLDRDKHQACLMIQYYKKL